jgi:hypothetical protein
VASKGTEAALFGPFGADLQATSTYLALLNPLFRQFQGEVQHSPGPDGTGSLASSHIPIGTMFLM